MPGIEDKASLFYMYDSLYGQLLEAFGGRDGDKGALARTYLDNIIFQRAMDKLGIDVSDMSPDGGEIPSSMATSIHSNISKLLENNGDITGRVCILLDRSASIMHGIKLRDDGAFFTPKPLARYICKAAIGSYILNYSRKAFGKEHRTVDEMLRGLNAGEIDDLIGKIKNIRIIDSSCGTGIFLEAALEELLGLRLKALQCCDNVPDIEYGIISDVIAGNLYGMDIDGYSVGIARKRLILSLAKCAYRKNVPFKTPNINVACGNALLPDGGLKHAGSFDVIAGNPPYMRIKSMFSDVDLQDRAGLKKEMSALISGSGLYRLQEGNLNLYKLFIERNLGLLRDGGSMGLIFPSSFLNEISSQKLRQHIFRENTVEEIVEFPERSRMFGDVNQATVILVCRKEAPGNGNFCIRQGVHFESLNEDRDDRINIGYKELDEMTCGGMEVPLLSCPAAEWDMIKDVRRFPPFKGDGSAPPVGTISVGHVDETIYRSYISSSQEDGIFVKGIHLKEYSVDLSPEGKQPRYVKKTEFMKDKPSAEMVVSKPRIIGRNTQNKACRRRLKFAPLPPGYLCGNSIKQIVVTDKDMNGLYLLALLNSSVLNWYFELFCSQNNIRNYSIEALPIPRASKGVQDIFARVAESIIIAGGKNREFLDRTIMDAMAYELYFLGAGEGGLIKTAGRLIEHYGPEHIPDILSKNKIIKKLADGISAQDRFTIIKKAAYK
ncbi:type I restriction endonuclease subunit M [Methanocella sp. CWC-04]|uniref:site-specific DNA-methyltransferase (adenine-specific) n=1 Tax=Methanooceanicella nereidis TaxID=2052831 RepID=A0AAP2RB05_9EURY|nr:Eco57I restriction-modification methylase domain-containing protein [Methanocella sp. CWC-04]MCD1293844.1 type I restriction endonuclease subunit M [Methanocella sp. CWC-04]